MWEEREERGRLQLTGGEVCIMRNPADGKEGKPGISRSRGVSAVGAAGRLDLGPGKVWEGRPGL